MNYDTFKDRLKFAMEGESNTSFAKKCELAEGTIRRYLRGEAYPPLDTLQIIANVNGYRLGWLASGEGEKKRNESLAVAPPPAQITAPIVTYDEYVQIPRYEVAASAGGGAVIHSEQIVDHLTFKADWVHNALGVPVASLALINVKGDSMEPTLSNGDVILIDMSKDGFDDNAVYVLRLNGSLLVKRVKRNFDGSVLVSSDNAMYPPDIIKNEVVDTLNVVGRVVWCGRRM